MARSDGPDVARSSLNQRLQMSHRLMSMFADA